jgi:transposase-like protein
MARKKFSAEFKAMVALEFLKGELTLSELSSKYEVHPTQLKEWKETLKEQAKTLFTQKNKEEDSNKGYVEALERKAGQLAIEIDFLKKNLTRYQQ